MMVSNSNGQNLHPAGKIYDPDRKVSNSNGQNLHARWIASSSSARRFQTPTDRIYTKTSSKSQIARLVSNSSGENLHSARNSIFSGYEY
nr:hypothetical protein [uncultured Campylobacter sp.]